MRFNSAHKAAKKSSVMLISNPFFDIHSSKASHVYTTQIFVLCQVGNKFEGENVEVTGTIN